MMDSFATVADDPGWGKVLDARIAALGLSKGWVDDGTAYVGDATGAASAFNAVVAFGSDASIWIVVPGVKPSATELQMTRTPAGHAVWTPLNRITVWTGC